MNFGLTPIDPDDPLLKDGTEIILRESGEIQTYRGKPQVRKYMFHCAVCQKEPVEIGSYAASATTSRDRHGAVTSEDGYIHGYVKCHGAFAEFAATYAQAWAAIDTRQKIVVFDNIEVVENKEAHPELPSGPEPGVIDV